MTHFELFPSPLTFKEDSNENKDDLDEREFQQIFIKVFAQTPKDIYSDNEYEDIFMKKSNQNQNEIGESTDISKGKSPKMKNVKDLLSNFDSDKLIIEIKDINTNYIKNLNYNFPKINSFAISDKKGNSEDKKVSSNFLEKKRDIFDIKKCKKFSIFEQGGAFIRTRNLINKILQNKNKKIFFDEELDVSENTKTRKNHADNIRKKIKARFLKFMIAVVNKKLKEETKKKFRPLPQKFVSYISKETNKENFELSFKEIFSKNFSEVNEISDIDLKNLNNNLSTLKYLEKNHEISEKIDYTTFKNLKMYEIFYEYLKSKQFEMDINKLKDENESHKYISKYIILAHNLIDFFST